MAQVLLLRMALDRPQILSLMMALDGSGLIAKDGSRWLRSYCSQFFFSGLLALRMCDEEGWGTPCECPAIDGY